MAYVYTTAWPVTPLPHEPKCLCGWRGRPVKTETAAWKAVDAHEKECPRNA